MSAYLIHQPTGLAPTSVVLTIPGVVPFRNGLRALGPCHFGWRI